MNDKLSKFSMRDAQRKFSMGGRAGREPAEELVLCGIIKSHTRGTVQLYSMRLSIHPRAIEQLGWMVRDCLDLDVDLPSARLRRVEAGCGVHLNKTYGGGRNTSKRLAVKFTLFPEMGWPCETIKIDPCTGVEIADGMMAFRFPEVIIGKIAGDE